MLTPKQEEYCKNRALKKMTQKDAYKNAYNATNMTDNAVYVEACRLEGSPKVSLRIKELEDEQTADILKENKWTRDNAYTELTWLISEAKKEIRDMGMRNASAASAIINSVKELNSIYEVTAEEVETEADGFIEALNGEAGEVWNDENNGDIPV